MQHAFPRTAAAALLVALTTAACHSTALAPTPPGATPSSASASPTPTAHPTPVETPTSTIQTLTGTGYKVEIPITWMMDTGSDAAMLDLAYAADPRATQVFQSLKPAAPENGETTVDAVRDTYKKRMGLGVVAADYQELGSTTMGGDKANVFAATDPSSKRRVVGAYTLHAGKVYFVSYGGAKADQDALRRMLDASVASWRWS